MPSPADRFRQRAAARQSPAPVGNAAPFASFLERHEDRQRRSRNKRRMLIVSVAVHIVVFGFLLLLSAWKVDELFSTTVEVKMLAASGDETSDTEAKPEPRARTNIGRAVGLEVVVTPEGARLEPRADLEPSPPNLQAQLQATLSQRLLPELRYPDKAKPLKLRGAVTALVDIDEEGRASAVNIKGPCLHPLLCEALQQAVMAIGSWPVAATQGPHGYILSVNYRFN